MLPRLPPWQTRLVRKDCIYVAGTRTCVLDAFNNAAAIYTSNADERTHESTRIKFQPSLLRSYFVEIERTKHVVC